MKIITIDTETYYDGDYSLRKMSTDAYVHDPRFELIGVGLSINGGEQHWYSGPDWQLYLQQFRWDNVAVLCWNTVFDAYILRHKVGISPKVWLDGMSMFRGIWGPEKSASLAKAAEHYGIGVKGTEVLDAKGKRRKDFTKEELARYGEYCKNDVDLTWKLWCKMAPGFPSVELKNIDLTLRMFVEPELELDKPGLEGYLKTVQAKKQTLLSTVSGERLPVGASDEDKKLSATMRRLFPEGVTRKDLMSNPKFASCLEAVGVIPPVKISPTTGKQTFAFAKTDRDFIALQEHENPAVQALVAARLGTKSTIEETRLEGLIASADRGPIPIGLNYAGAKTKRWSGGAAGTKLNFQNLPGRSRIKDFIVAPPGKVIVGADLSNIELRVGLWLGGEMERLRALGQGKDLYKDFASTVFDVPYDEVDGEQRFIGKTSCIAEGQLVLTPRGLVPIQDVTLDDHVWDGVEWVAHDGVVHQGIKHVIEYQGLVATADHKVYVEEDRTRDFGEAAVKGLPIIHSGGGKPTPVGEARPIGRANVYDLLNAGPRHRFTVSGVLVSNCLSLIYGVGAARLQEALIIGAKNFLGVDLDISLDECQRIVSIYRAEHRGIVRCWDEGRQALRVLHAKQFDEMFHKGLAKVDGEKGIRLPTGLHLRYHNLRQMEENNKRFWACDARRGIDRLYGAKVFQQFTQATARCVLAERLPIIRKRYPIKLTIHDANYILADEGKAGPALAWMIKQMITPPDWMPDIPLDAEGGWGRTLQESGREILKTVGGKLIHAPSKKVLTETI